MNKSSNKKTCPRCFGAGRIGDGHSSALAILCTQCYGEGEVSVKISDDEKTKHNCDTCNDELVIYCECPGVSASSPVCGDCGGEHEMNCPDCTSGLEEDHCPYCGAPGAHI